MIEINVGTGVEIGANNLQMPLDRRTQPLSLLDDVRPINGSEHNGSRRLEA
jgi:hypothetical protein